MRTGNIRVGERNGKSGTSGAGITRRDTTELSGAMGLFCVLDGMVIGLSKVIELHVKDRYFSLYLNFASMTKRKEKKTTELKKKIIKTLTL